MCFQFVVPMCVSNIFLPLFLSLSLFFPDELTYCLQNNNNENYNKIEKSIELHLYNIWLNSFCEGFPLLNHYHYHHHPPCHVDLVLRFLFPFVEYRALSWVALWAGPDCVYLFVCLTDCHSVLLYICGFHGVSRCVSSNTALKAIGIPAGIAMKIH